MIDSVSSTLVRAERNSSTLQQPLWEILYVGYGDWHLWRWDGFRTRSAQLCRFLARSNRVTKIYVLNEPIFLHRIPSGLTVPRNQRFRALPLRGGCKREEDKVYLLDPSRFLIGPDRLKRRYTIRHIRKSVSSTARPLILWIANVHKAYLMEQIPASIRVFDAIDDWESVSVYERFGRRTRTGYETVRARSDIIYTVSSHLQKQMQHRSKTPHVIHLPNGVDPELFKIPTDPPAVRRNARKSRRPVLTYVGVLSERIDLDLIEKIALEWPSCHFQLIGPMSRNVEQRWRKLRRIPNLAWRGLVHHSKVPEILRSSDVLLIPHAESPLSLSMDPLKLYEYLTTGLPIVSTPVPPTHSYASLIYVGTGQQFSQRIGDALEEIYRPTAEDLWHARIQESRNHHWDKRIAKIESDLCNILGATV